jgi:hypothetical protein
MNYYYGMLDITGAPPVIASIQSNGGVEVSMVCLELGSTTQWPGY